jgi:hypothetical protein
MSLREVDFAQQIAFAYAIHKTNANRNAELTAISAALASDVTTHDMTIQAPAAALRIIMPPVHSRFTNDINLIVNKGKGGNLSNNTMIAAIDGVLGVVSPPGLVDVPYLSGVPPYANGSVLTCTQGNWVGTPTSKNYQFRRNSVNFGSNSSTATYTIVTATDTGKVIDCVVTAINAQGSTVAPPSNGIRIP